MCRPVCCSGQILKVFPLVAVGFGSAAADMDA